jgi:hypothetical protein
VDPFVVVAVKPNVGTGFTVTTVDVLLEQPLASVTVTVYVVVVNGLTVIEAVAAFVLHA